MAKHFARFISILFLGGVLHGSPASAQQTAGSVVGVARDPSLAVLPGVTIVIRNTETGLEQQTVTNDVGSFNLPVVPPGRYSFSAELSGFKTATGEFMVELNRRTNLNIVLELGQASETIQVTAATPVETTDTQVGDTFETRLIIDLPSPNQDVNSLALLSPNVVDINTTGLTRGQLLSQVSSPVGGAVGSVGGSRARNNSFNVDGVDNNDPIATGPQGNVIQDAVAEFTILKSNFNAEFGQATGGQFNIVTKSGTNDYAGNIFWYHQNRHLNSADFLTETAIESGRIDEKPTFDLNRLGGTFGGPLVENELFFFGAYEYEKVNAAGTTTNFVFPTQEGFDRLASLPPGTTRFGAPGAVSPFVLDFIRRWGLMAPQANLDPSRFPVVLGVPIPVGAVSQNIPSFSRSDRFMGNVDWQMGANDRWQFRFFSDFGPDGITAGTPKEELNADREVENYLTSASWVHTFSAASLNDFKLAFHRQVTDNVISDPAAENIPNLQVAEIPLSIGPSGGVPSGSITNNFQIYNSTSYATDRHFWKFGVDFRNNGVTDIGFVSPRGNYRYVNFEDLLTDVAPTQIGQRGLGGPERILDYYSLNWFVQDEWRLSDRFNLSLGLRYEFNSLPEDLAVQEQQAAGSVPGVIEFDRPTVEKDNWGPRAGFAWDLFGTGRTALRGGYALSYNPIFGAFVGGGMLPAALQQVFFSFCVPNCPIPIPATSFLEQGGIPPELLPLDTPEQIRAATASYVPDLERPRLHTFTVSLEHEITPGWVSEVRYLRTDGSKLSVQAQLNAGVVPPMGAFLPTFINPAEVPSQTVLDSLPTVDQFLARVVRPYNQYGFTGSTLTTHLPIGESEYNGISVELARRYANGLMFNANYTHSRFYDHATNEFFNSFMNPRRPADWRNLDNEWARSVLDVPHRFVMSGLWDLPFGGDHPITGNWSVSATYVYQSGVPWTPLSQTNALGNGDVQVQRAIFNASGTSDTGTLVTPVRNSAGATVGYLANDPNARYVQAGVGSFPTAGRNSLRAPGVNNVDMIVTKDFPLGDRRRFQFQAQIFNLFDNDQFTAANLLAVDPGLGLNYSFVGSAGFNDVRRAGGTGGARIVQLAVKFFF